MIKKFKTILKMISIMRKGNCIGDAAVLKLTILYLDEGQSHHRQMAIAKKELNFTNIQLTDLKMNPKGSFDLAYSESILLLALNTIQAS